MAKEKELLIALDDAEALRLQQGSRSEGVRHLLEAKQNELQQIQTELEGKEKECEQLKRQLAEVKQEGSGSHTTPAASKSTEVSVTER